MLPSPTDASLPTIIKWPQDEAAHDGVQWEIWWFTAVLNAGHRSFGAQALITHVEAGTSLILTLTDLDSDRECSSVTFETFDTGVLSREELDIRTTRCSVDGSYATGYRVQSRIDDDCAFDLLLKPTRPILHNCGSGTFLLQGIPTVQYSVGALEAQGTIHWFDEELAVTGRGWHDRQWEMVNRDGQPEFTWLGIALDNGDTLSFYHPVGSRGFVTIVRQDGTHILTSADAKPTDICPTALGRMVPSSWCLTIPAMQAELTIGQIRILDNRNIYTGAVEAEGKYEGRPCAGQGFCDISAPMTQHSNQPRSSSSDH
jgi:predicted secreted hydrolase